METGMEMQLGYGQPVSTQFGIEQKRCARVLFLEKQRYILVSDIAESIEIGKRQTMYDNCQTISST